MYARADENAPRKIRAPHVPDEKEGMTEKSLAEIVELARERTVVVVTHNMQQATRVADKTAFFYLGELLEEGPTKQLFSQPREERTKDYLTGRFS